jgi:hypothetical protein
LQVYLSLVQKIGILAEQYNELPRGVIEDFLRRNDEDLDKASAQLLMSKDSSEDQVCHPLPSPCAKILMHVPLEAITYGGKSWRLFLLYTK